MIALQKEHVLRFITASVIGAVFWFVFFYLPDICFSYLLFGILCTILATEWKNFFKLNDFWFWFIMPWYPILPFAIMIYMSNVMHYRILIYYLFIIVFGFDSTAYITGKLLGFRKIIPSLSPGKTIEGCIGGYIGALFSFYFALDYNQISLRPDLLIILTFITCAAAFVGDIFESFLKRKAHIKDSGNILPGHGGFLDRFDAVMMASLIFFLFRNELVPLLCPCIA